jgi:hypothetical protein
MITAEVSRSIRGDGSAAVDVSRVICRDDAGWWMSMMRSLIVPPGVENARLPKNQTPEGVQKRWLQGCGRRCGVKMRDILAQKF